MTNENETVDVLHELNELHDLIWEYGDDCICLHEGSEGATIESTDKINEKIEFIKREIAAKDEEIDILRVRNIETQNAVDGRNKELARRAALIKELADALCEMTHRRFNCVQFPHCDTCKFVCKDGRRLCALVAKAREVVK